MNTHQEAELLASTKDLTCVYSKKAARAMLENLHTEAKAAYHIRLIASQLFKAVTCIPTKKSSNLPNDIGFHIHESQKLFDGEPIKITIVELGQLEDLYYATCAKAKELHEDLVLRLDNGFIKADDFYFTHNNPALPYLGPVSVGQLKKSLEHQVQALSSQKIVGPLDQALKLRHKFETMIRQSMNGYTTPSATIEGLESVVGLQDTSKMSVAMIFGSLAEKHLPVHASNTSISPQVAAAADGDDAVTATEPQIDMANLLSQADRPGDVPHLEGASSHQSLCTCVDACLCKLLCGKKDNVPCQCKVGIDYLDPEAVYGSFELPNGGDGPHPEWLPTSKLNHGTEDSIQPKSNSPSVYGQADRSQPDNLRFNEELDSKPIRSRKSSASRSVAASNHSVRDRSRQVSSKGRQAVEKRSKKAFDGKPKHPELPISNAVVEKLMQNGVPMNIKIGSVKRTKTYESTVSTPFNMAEINNPIDEVAVHEVDRKPIFTVQDTSDQVSRAGELVSDSSSYQSDTFSQSNMEDLSIWSPACIAATTYGAAMGVISTQCGANDPIMGFDGIHMPFEWMNGFE